MPALLMPVLVLLALRFGVLPPTEVSTSAVVYAMLVSGLLLSRSHLGMCQGFRLYGWRFHRRRPSAYHGVDGGGMDP